MITMRMDGGSGDRCIMRWDELNKGGEMETRGRDFYWFYDMYGKKNKHMMVYRIGADVG